MLSTRQFASAPWVQRTIAVLASEYLRLIWKTSRFTIEPRANGTLVRIETVLQTKGINGLALKLFGRRILAPLYADELERLEKYAQAHRLSAAA